MHDAVAAELWKQRRVMLSGPLDHTAAIDLAAKLMALDGSSDADVDLIINSPGGPTGAVSTVLDVIATMQADVNGICIGGAEGTAAILLACCTGVRRAAPHARLNVQCDQRRTIEGSSSSIENEMAAITAERERLIGALARATGQPPEAITIAIERSEIMNADQAVEFGLVDHAVVR